MTYLMCSKQKVDACFLKQVERNQCHVFTHRAFRFWHAEEISFGESVKRGSTASSSLGYHPTCYMYPSTQATRQHVCSTCQHQRLHAYSQFDLVTEQTRTLQCSQTVNIPISKKLGYLKQMFTFSGIH